MFINKKKEKFQNLDQGPIAFPINYTGKGSYNKSFKNLDFGILFEDDGHTGYVYATNQDHTKIFNAILLYNYSDNAYIPEGQIFLVLNESLEKMAVFYEDQFQAILDFRNKQAYSRLKSPQLQKTEWINSHTWNTRYSIGLI